MPKKLPDHWRQTFCTLIAEGYTRTDAANAVGVSLGTVRGYLGKEPDFKQLYDEARESVCDQIRNKLWGMGMKAAYEVDDEGEVTTRVDAATVRWALDHLIKWNLPEAKETQQIELTGSEGGPLEVTVTHDYDRLLAKLEQAGLIRPGPAALVSPEDQPVLPARTD